MTKPLVVIGTVEASKEVRIEAFEPGDVELFGEVGSLELAGVESGRYSHERRAPICRACGFGPAADSRNRGIAAASGGNRHFSKLACHIRHVARDRKRDIELGSTQARLETSEWPCGGFAIENEAVGQMVVDLLWLRKRDHHLRERGGEPIHHPLQERGLAHLQPGLGSAHAPAVTAREHQQRGLHHDYHRPAVRAIDFHVHLPTPDWLDKSMKGYVEAAEAYFRSKIVRRTLAELASDYEKIDVLAVLLAWDAETATNRPRVSNELVAQACADFPKAFVGFGSVDPLKGERAVAELDNISFMELKGVKLHPSLQAFAPDDERYWPLYERCEELGLAILFHTGTSGIGAGQPGGQGIRLDYARPIRLDAVAASFPNLNIIAAHFGYPWHVELLAMALHKTNIYIDISGWAPRYIPAEVLRDMKGRLQDQFVFGSDYPFIQPERCLEELATIEIPEPALQKLLVGNGKRLLGLS